ncbi:2OG-Fe(II) oxygenase [uncultured Gammaproteobacteria bacterium]
MPSLTTEFAVILAGVKRPGDFFACGVVDLLPPQLEIEGVGPIALPLLPVQAQQVIAVAEAAPYGRGPQTILDPAVRRTWQIGAERVRIGGKRWPRTLESILAKVTEDLGVTDPVSADLYKLLVYDQGSFFLRHRDTEKSAGMFATLVIVLPSLYSGGELVVRHKEREVRLDLGSDEPAEARFAAFYADCVHEVLPVTEGCRLALIYNLVRKGCGQPPQVPDYDAEQVRIGTLLRSWAQDRAIGPDKLVYPLEHAYTQAEVGFGTLKGADAAVAGVLGAAAQDAGCELHLALLSIEEDGWAEHTGDYRRRRYGDDNDEFEIGEVSNRSEFLSEWRRPDGLSSPLVKLPVAEGEVSPPDTLDKLEPDETHFREATGNEGASFDRTYHASCLVLWPRARLMAVLNQAGLPITLPYLADLAERWQAGGDDRRSPLWQQAHDLAGHMLGGWPDWPWYAECEDPPSETARMLPALTRLGDAGRITELLGKIGARGGFAADDAPALAEALAMLPPGEAGPAFERLITATAAVSCAACASLLARAVTTWPAWSRTELSTAAILLVRALPGVATASVPVLAGQRRSMSSPVLVIDLLSALVVLDPVLAGRAVDHILATPRTFTLDGEIAPAALALIAEPDIRPAPAVERLRLAALDHLRARIAQPLAPPADWTRAHALPCSCPYCGELSRFLANPQAKSWEFKAAQARRSHVESTILNAKCDVATTTVRQGTPHRLVCTKTQASFERQITQRRQDLAYLERLESTSSCTVKPKMSD